MTTYLTLNDRKQKSFGLYISRPYSSTFFCGKKDENRKADPADRKIKLSHKSLIRKWMKLPHIERTGNMSFQISFVDGKEWIVTFYLIRGWSPFVFEGEKNVIIADLRKFLAEDTFTAPASAEEYKKAATRQIIEYLESV